MGSLKKRLKRAQQNDSESGSEEDVGFDNEGASEQDYGISDDYSDGEEVDEEEGVSEGEDDKEEDGDDDEGGVEESDEESGGDDDEEGEEEDDEESGDDEEGEEDADAVGPNFEEMEELEKEYKQLQDREKSLIQNLKKHKDEDIIKGQAIRSQKVLWDKALELRIQMQKVFSNSNRLPQEPMRSLFCESDKVSDAYSDVIASAKGTLDSLLQLQEALIENNPSIAEVRGDGESQPSLISSDDFDKMDVDKDNEWSRIFQMQSSMAPFRNKAIDKWQRKADVNSGAVAKKAKLLAFNQNISDQVATYMRDPSKMVRSMQMKREQVGVFGSVAQQDRNDDEGNADGDPELLADSEFYQQLLKEFLETVDHVAGLAYIVPGKSQSKKRKVVDRRASKSRKIRYHVHEKIVNFMAPEPMDLPPMAPMLFDNLFGLKTPKSTSAA